MKKSKRCAAGLLLSESLMMNAKRSKKLRRANSLEDVLYNPPARHSIRLSHTGTRRVLRLSGVQSIIAGEGRKREGEPRR